MLVVTGAGGQVGRELGLLLDKLQIPNIQLNRADLDISDSAAVLQVLDSVRSGTEISALINCAAYTNVEAAEAAGKDHAWQFNVVGPRVLADYCKTRNIRLVHISTDYVFGDIQFREELLTEVETPNPLSVYGRSKLEGEKAIQEIYPQGSYIVRTSWVYGKYGANFVKKMLQLGEELPVVKVVCDQFGQPTSAVNLARALLDVATAPSELEAGIYHFSDVGVCSWFDFAHEIFALAKFDASKLLTISTNQLSTKARRPMFSALSHAKWNEAVASGTLHVNPQAWQAALAASGLITE